MNSKDLIVKKITFPEIKNYWIEVDHFKEPNKKVIEVITSLGHLKNTLEQPRRQSYGLFLRERLIGVTKLVEWENEFVRYRTLNIRKEFRGSDLGWSLLMEAYSDGWQQRNLFGWVRRSHYDWSRSKGFVELDGIWNEDHIAMVLKKENIIKK